MKNTLERILDRLYPLESNQSVSNRFKNNIPKADEIKHFVNLIVYSDRQQATTISTKRRVIEEEEMDLHESSSILNQLLLNPTSSSTTAALLGILLQQQLFNPLTSSSTTVISVNSPTDVYDEQEENKEKGDAPSGMDIDEEQREELLDDVNFNEISELQQPDSGSRNRPSAADDAISMPRKKTATNFKRRRIQQQQS